MEELLKFIGGGEPASAVVLAVLAVGLGKILEKYLNKDVEDLKETLQLRTALREEVNALREEVQSLRREVDDWRGKYWEQVNINSSHQATIQHLQSELQDMRDELDEYKTLYTHPVQKKLTRKASESKE